MGGFTKIQLKDCSEKNIDKQNQILYNLGLRKDIRFYSEVDIATEYAFYQTKPEREKYYPPHLFPQDIKTYDEFKKHWTSMGVAMIPPVGALTFDCYFGRTSKNAMHIIARYILEYGKDQISYVDGSYSTFVERCNYKSKTKQNRLLEFVNI